MQLSKFETFEVFCFSCKALCRRSKRSNPSQLFKASAKEATASSCNAFAERSKRRRWKQRSSKAAARLRAPGDDWRRNEKTKKRVKLHKTNIFLNVLCSSHFMSLTADCINVDCINLNNYIQLHSNTYNII